MINTPLTTARAVGQAVLALPTRKPTDQLIDIAAKLRENDALPGGFRFDRLPREPTMWMKYVLDLCQRNEVLATDAAIVWVTGTAACGTALACMTAALKVMGDDKGHVAVTLSDVLDRWPNFPDHDDLHKVWACQHVNGRDMLMQPEAWR